MANDGTFYVAGINANHTDYPYQVKIYNDNAFLCSGTVLATYLVLMAAHCFKEGSVTRMTRWTHIKVVAQDPHKRIGLSRPPILHQAWEADGTASKEYDIALLELDDNLRDVVPAILSPINVYDENGDVNAKHGMTGNVIVAGWGESQNDGKPDQGLRMAVLNLIKRTDCAAKWGSEEFPVKAFCASGDGVDACRGDSGGPVSCIIRYNNTRDRHGAVPAERQVVCGIVSFGTGVECGRTTGSDYKPTVYVDTTRYTKWILQQSCQIRATRTADCKSNIEFQCCNKFCIPAKSQCDGFRDCLDGSDEANCDSRTKQAKKNCTSTELCMREEGIFTAISPNVVYLNTPFPVHIFQQPNSFHRKYDFSAWFKGPQSGINVLETQSGKFLSALMEVTEMHETTCDMVLLARDAEDNEFYRQQQVVKGDDKRSFVFTDKKAYSAGEEIHFGAVFLDASPGEATALDIHIRILDSVHQTIWQVFIRNSREIEQGFLSEHLRLAHRVNFGQWQIIMRRNKSPNGPHAPIVETFEVREASPPDFTVNVEVPGHLTTETKGTFLSVDVQAVKDDGINVIGRCEIRIAVVDECGQNSSKFLTFSYQIDESLSALVDVAEITQDFPNGGRLELRTIVTDKFTGQKLTTFASTSFSKCGITIQEISSHRFRGPNLPYRAQFQIVDQDQNEINITKGLETTSTIVELSSENGAFEIEIPANALSSDFNITYKNVTFTKNVPMIHSNAQHSLQIKIQGNSPNKIIQNAPFQIQVMASDLVDALHMIIHSAGEIVFSHSYAVANANEYLIKTLCPEEIGRDATIVVFTYINKIFVSDLLHVNILNWSQKTNSTFDLSASADVVEPGQNVSITIKALPGNFVYLHAEDASNEDPDEFASKKWLIEEILQTTKLEHFEPNLNFKDLRQLDLAVLTNAPEQASFSIDDNFSCNDASKKNKKIRNQRIWISRMIEITDETTTIQIATPNIPGTWRIKGYCVVSEAPRAIELLPSTSVQTSTSLSISISVPNFIVHSEILKVPIFIRNSSPIENPVESIHIVTTLVDASRNKISNNNQTKITACTMSPEEKTVCEIQFDRIGTYSIIAEANTTDGNIPSSTEKFIVVKSGGVKKFKMAASSLLSLNPSTKTPLIIQRILSGLRSPPCLFANFGRKQPRILKDHETPILTLSSDLMTVVADLADEIPQNFPDASVETNLLKMTANLVTLQYLKAKYPLEIDAKVKSNKSLKICYQTHLSFLADKSVFPNDVEIASKDSIFLTAWSVRLLIAAKEFIFVEERIINQAISFLQNFEDHRIKESPADASSLAQTAYTLTTFLEAGKYFTDAVLFEKMRQNLRSHFNDTDASLNAKVLIAYAEHVWKAKNPNKASHRTEYFKALRDGPLGNYSSLYEGLKPTSRKVEFHSYLILINYLRKNHEFDAIIEANELLRLLNSPAGFVSAYDTAVAISALAEVALREQVSQSDIQISLHGWSRQGNSSKLATVKSGFMAKTYVKELPKKTKQVCFGSSGKGLVFAKLSYPFINPLTASASGPFNLTLDYAMNSSDLNLKIGANFTKNNGVSKMAVMEVNLPSGYAFYQPETDAELRREHAHAQIWSHNYLQGNTKLEIYFASVPNVNSIDFQVFAGKAFDVRNIAESFVKMYEFGNPHKYSTVLYQVL